MSCNMSGCRGDTNIWKVTNDNRSLPHYKEFFVCDFDLNLAKDLKQVQKALVMGRFAKQSTNLVQCDGWNLEKVERTWKKCNKELSCCKCDETKRLWFVQKEGKRVKMLCNLHINRYPEKLKIRVWNDPVGISTYEESWDNID